MRDTLVFLLLMGIMYTLREGFWHRDKKTPSKTLSFCWHIFGWLARFFLFCVTYRVSYTLPIPERVFWSTIVILVEWPLFDISCNIGLMQKWNYIGTTSILDKLRRVLKIRWIWFTRNF